MYIIVYILCKFEVKQFVSKKRVKNKNYKDNNF